MGLGKLLRSNWPGQTVKRDVEPLEGTNMSLFNSIIPNWWSENVTGTFPVGNAALAEKVFVANRCQQMNSQQIAGMPLRFHGTYKADQGGPAWVSSPDPNWYPNGIADALFNIVWQVYAHGFSCQYITDFYADGFPRTWTVLDSASLHVDAKDGRRRYKVGDTFLDPARIVQIDRNPGGVTGTSALRSFAQQAWGLLAAGNQAMTVTQGGTPKFYLKSERKLTKEQAEALQTQWMAATAARNGAPPVLPPEIVPTEMSFNPSDLALLDSQEWNAKMIANAYGVPSVLLNMALQGGLTYQNPGALGEMWWRFELRPTATRIANAFTAQMLPRGSWVTFDAADTFAELTEMSDDNDPQLAEPSVVAPASPAQQPGRLTAVTG